MESQAVVAAPIETEVDVDLFSVGADEDFSVLPVLERLQSFIRIAVKLQHAE